jgi:hypothetical protein
MSIISEALKKAQEQRNGFTTQADVDPDATGIVKGIDAGRIPAKKVFLITAVFFITLLLAGAVTVLMSGQMRPRSGSRAGVGYERPVKPENGNDPEKGTQENTDVRSSEPGVDAARGTDTGGGISSALDNKLRSNADTLYHYGQVGGEIPELEGIMFSPGDPRVILGGSIVGEGQTVAGVTVKDIFPQKVVVIVGGEERELFLK